MAAVADFRGYLCWVPATAGITISTEAVSPPEAVFVATHAPLHIRRARIQGRTLIPTDKVVDEHGVLRDFLGRKPDTGTLLMPVVGESGSGKSHLVRWIRSNIRDSERVKVIYLEKARTSLRAVIDALLEGTEDESLAHLRDEIRTFSGTLDETALARRLVNALNEALAATSPADMGGTARILAGPRGLAAILQDPYIQQYMLEAGKYIPQLASQLLHDRTGGSPERPTGFTADDLPLNVRDIGQAAAMSGRLLGQLLTKQELRSAAVDLLNQHLEAAIRSSSNLATGRLHEAMLQVRQEYARQGKEIILLIEDFALIQGVQRELLDAVTEPAIRHGTARYAPIRTLMAVTTGYFRDLPETVMTRVAAGTTGYVYNVDVAFSEENQGAEQIASFVGRYLNAARIGLTELARLGPGNVPNHCEKCPVHVQCHDAFGASAEGYGLYPFNKSALVRCVHSVAPPDNPWAFVPRAVLGGVVRPTLIEDSRDLADGSFPGPRFRERFPTAPIDEALPTAVAEVIEDSDDTNTDRRKLVLELWGDAATEPDAIPSGILEAFALPPLPIHKGQRIRQPAVTPKRSRRSPSSGQPSTTTPVSPSLGARLEEIEEWGSRDRLLPQAVSADLRSVIAEAVIRRYSWQTPLMRELPRYEVSKAWPNRSTVVSIAGANGEGLPGTENAPLRFTRTASNSQFFRSLLLARQRAEGARAEDMRRLARLAETTSGALTRAIQRQFEISGADLVAGFRASLLGAVLGGRAWPGMDEADLLSAALDAGASWHRSDTTVRTPQWQQAFDRHRQHRAALVDRLRSSVGVAQGAGAVRMIDAARALPILRRATAEWTWKPEQSVPEWARPAVAGFSSWGTWMTGQLDKSAEFLTHVRRLLPRGAGGRETVAAVRAALREAEKVGLAPSRADAQELATLLEKADDADWGVIVRLEGDLEKVSSTEPGSEEWMAAVLRAIAPDRGNSLDTIGACLRKADQWLDDALEQAAARSDTVGDAAAFEVRRLLQQWAALSNTDGDQ
jgi:hypothetical protein